MDFLLLVGRWLVDPAHWQGSDGIPTRLVEHIHLSVESAGIGALIALPVGITLGHYGRFGALAINISNAARAIPSFGILVIAFQVFGLGDLPIVLALTALAVPPMVTNSYVALREVDPDIRDAARGMGYRELAQVLRVELPLAVPLIMAGIRTSAVQVVAAATLAALIAGGGLGRYIVDGLATQDYPETAAGRLLIAALAVVATMVAACGGTNSGGTTKKGTIIVGGFKFPESSILAQIYGEALAHDAYTVTYKLNLGTREVVAPALKNGDIDLYPGYAATDLEYWNNKAGEATGDAAATTAKLTSHVQSQGLAALNPSPTVDQNAFAVTKETQQKYNLSKLSDLDPIGHQLVLGAGPECPTRPYCLPGLQTTYGIHFKDFKALDTDGPATRAAFKNGTIQVGLVFSSDGDLN